MDWFTSQFGRDRLHGEVVLPTPDFFPEKYQGRAEDVRTVFDRLCAHMGVDPARVVLEYSPADDAELLAHVPIRNEYQGAAGHHQMRGDQSVITIQEDQARRPVALVATIAHELGHALLLGEARISRERKDFEPLTDLLTVFLGLGIFTANAAFDYALEIRAPTAVSDRTDVRLRARAPRLDAGTRPSA